MIICRTVLSDAPAEITGSHLNRKGEIEFDVERLDRQPWGEIVEYSHGGWCCYPLYTAAVKRNQITELAQIEGLESPETIDLLSVVANVVVGAPLS